MVLVICFLFTDTSELPGSLLYAGDFALVSQLTEANTAAAVVAQVGVRTTANLAAGVCTTGVLGLSMLLDLHRLLCHVVSSSFLLDKGCAQLGQQFLSFFVGVSGGDDRNVHATQLF